MGNRRDRSMMVGAAFGSDVSHRGESVAEEKKRKRTREGEERKKEKKKEVNRGRRMARREGGLTTAKHIYGWGRFRAFFC